VAVARPARVHRRHALTERLMDPDDNGDAAPRRASTAPVSGSLTQIRRRQAPPSTRLSRHRCDNAAPPRAVGVTGTSHTSWRRRRSIRLRRPG
jgi:hypothetical protein